MPKKPDPRFPKIVEVVVEIPQGSRNKYEFDEKAGVMRLDRVLSSAVFYNFEYGFIDGTRADDGDHTDALILLAEPTFPGCHVTARPVGGLRMRDDKGDDFKVLCVALGDPLHSYIKTIDQVPEQRLREIEHFFADVQAARGQARRCERLDRHRPCPPGAPGRQKALVGTRSEPTAPAAESDH